MITAYHRWLYQTAQGNPELIASMLMVQAMQQHPGAMELLEQTGDVAYTERTFQKAAAWVCEQLDPVNNS